MPHQTESFANTHRFPAFRHRLILLCGIALLHATLSLAAGTSNDDALPDAWTLRNAVRFAVHNNPDSRMARNRIEAAQASIAMEKSSFYPRLDLNSHYDQTNTPMHSFGNILNQGAFNQGIDFNNPGRTDTLGIGVRLGYRFFNGGRDLAGMEAAEAQTVSARMEMAAVQAQLAFEVVRAFQRIVQAEGLLTARQTAVDAFTASLAVARARYEEGVLLKAELLYLEMQQAQSREALSQARHALALSRRLFLTLLGLEDGPMILDSAQDGGQEVPQTASHDQRHELKSMEAVILAAKAKIRQARGGRYPSLEGYAGYDADKGYATDGSGDSWLAGVKLQYNLSDGGRTAAEIARASALLAEAQERKRKTELAIILEVKQAEFALHDADERLQVTEKSVAQALESARINRVRFKEGTLLSADLIGVETRLTDAMAHRVVAETSRRIAIADLRRALGMPQFSEMPDSPPEHFTK